MSEENTEPIEEPTEEVAPIEEPTIKSKKARSELQLKALEKARQKSYKIRAEQAAIKKQNTKQVESKKTEEVSNELHEELPEDLNENIREDVAAEESHIERVERHAERQQFNDHINNLIDERVKYKPIVKSKYKLINEVYVLRD
jgi:hypothetical protein